MGMPGRVSYLRKHHPEKYLEACRKGGRASAAKIAQHRTKADVLASAAAEKAAQEEAALRRSTNENLITADGEAVS